MVIGQGINERARATIEELERSNGRSESSQGTGRNVTVMRRISTKKKLAPVAGQKRQEKLLEFSGRGTSATRLCGGWRASRQRVCR